MVSFRGYHVVGEKEQAVKYRYTIIKKLIDVNADPDYFR